MIDERMALRATMLASFLQELSVSARFNQQWVDPRLRFESWWGEDYVVLRGHSEDRVWRPDTYFTNLRASYVQQFPHSGVWVYSNGTVISSLL